ncbi:inositol polyphosphate multikinase isoform X1 [Arvicola amphibius]|uniref:inositol polyphosphate multikinase isoform X1 n=1 Tax=Arvicola amphibius TaxID=1047088 RepID=UPI0018E32EC0|nr:inositol polyphosphate multikinase isoform X1 [Arvicola amphibius]
MAAEPPALRLRPPGSAGDSPPVPRLLGGCVPLSHQVAGHMYGKDKVGILQPPDGTVLKQLQPPPRGPRELEFYTMVYAADCARCCSPGAAETPCQILWRLVSSHRTKRCIPKLEDVTHKFNKPCIMDVKIGRKIYDPFASSEKIQQQVSKYPLMEEIGFLVLGMRVYHVHSDSYETQNQHYGRSLTKETLKEGVSKFFHNGFCLRKDAIAASIQKVEKILQWFENQKQLNFYASSLLFVYEGSSQPATTKSHERTLAGKFLSKGHLSDAGVLECNNNFHLFSSPANGTSVGKSLSKVYARHRKLYSKKHHSQTSLKVETLEQDNGWKSMSQEHLNGNVLSQLEKVFYHLPAGRQETADVEVRMIDFAHVFPSNTVDEGYVYGLKHLIAVLRSILDS